jgi:hypothetical protein
LSRQEFIEYITFDDTDLWQVMFALSFICVANVTMMALFIALYFSKSAVIDKGIFTGLQMVDWYHLHDYIIDEVNCIVVVTTSRMTFLTLKGTTQPLKVDRNDIPKLVFILNKNKNKFSQKLQS